MNDGIVELVALVVSVPAFGVPEVRQAAHHTGTGGRPAADSAHRTRPELVDLTQGCGAPWMHYDGGRAASVLGGNHVRRAMFHPGRRNCLLRNGLGAGPGTRLGPTR